jgi:hypothetical protein
MVSIQTMPNDYLVSRVKRGGSHPCFTQKGATAMRAMSFHTATSKTVSAIRSRALNIALWVLQVFLAAAYVAHGWMMVSPPPELLTVMNEQLGEGCASSLA